MDVAELLTDAFGRISESVHEVVEGLSPAQLAYRPDDRANSIAWLIWHLTRIQDDHLAAIAGVDQIWMAEGWAARFDLPFDASETGYGQGPRDVAAVAVESGELLTGYHDAVQRFSLGLVGKARPGDLDRIVDERWDPPVSMGVRLVSVIGDAMAHLGQAAYVRGLVERGACD